MKKDKALSVGMKFSHERGKQCMDQWEMKVPATAEGSLKSFSESPALIITAEAHATPKPTAIPNFSFLSASI